MAQSPASSADWRASTAEALGALRRWPWLDTLRVLRQRFREDRLGLTASSLTFTTLIALLPLLTVMLAVFTAFPMFGSLQGALEKYFLQNLVPDNIARPVMKARYGSTTVRAAGPASTWSCSRRSNACRRPSSGPVTVTTRPAPPSVS